MQDAECKKAECKNRNKQQKTEIQNAECKDKKIAENRKHIKKITTHDQATRTIKQHARMHNAWHIYKNAKCENKNKYA